MKKTLAPLTSLRFFAALAIVIEHTKANFHATAWITSALPYDYGVSFFFVLSGFILTYTHPKINGIRDAYNFYVARFARVWPLHVATFVLVLIVLERNWWFVGISSEHWLEIGIANLLLLHAWVPLMGVFFSFNGASWSISAELFFYLMFPLLLNRWARTWHWKNLLVIFCGCAILTVTTVRGWPNGDPHFPLVLSSTGIAYISPFVRIIEFVIGINAASIFVRYENRVPGCMAVWTIIEIASLLSIPEMWVLTRSLPDQIAGHSLGASSWTLFAAHSGAAPAFGLVVLVMAFGRGLLSRALGWRPLIILGEASFALYMVHQPLITSLYVHHEYFDRVPDSLLFAGYWTVTVGSAFMLWHFVEKPCRRIIRASLESRRQSTTTLDPA